MNPIYIQKRNNPVQCCYIDSEAALRNWAEGHPDFTKYRFYEADVDRFIITPRDINPNAVDNAKKLLKAVEDHFERMERFH